MQKIKIISINSLAAHKTISLKAQLAILGSSVLPVPSVILSGTNSSEGVQKQYINIEPILEGTLRLALSKKQKTYLFIGFLGNVENAIVVKDFILKNKQNLSLIYVDPIAGDNNKSYIEQKIIDKWPEILSLSNFAFPNLTELKLFSGLPFDEEKIEKHIEAFNKRFPKLNYIVTSYSINNTSGLMLYCNEKKTTFFHQFFDKKIDGTGDVFSSFFLKFHLLHHYSLEQACSAALTYTLKQIENTVTENLDEIELGIQFNSTLTD